MKAIFFTVCFVCSILIAKAQSAYQLKADAENAELQEDYDQAAELFLRAAKAFEDIGISYGECYFGAGQNYMKIKRYSDAITPLKKSYENLYNTGISYRLLSDAYSFLQQFSEAEQVLLEGIEKLPEERIEFERKLAYLYFNSGQYEKSATALDELLKENPDNKNDLYLKGFSLERIQEFDEAIENFSRILEQHPDDKNARKMWAYTFFEKLDQAYEKAIKRYNGMDNAKLADYVETKQQLKEFDNEYEKARILLEDSRKDFPNDKMLINALYKVYKKQNNTEKMNEMKKLL